MNIRLAACAKILDLPKA